MFIIPERPVGCKICLKSLEAIKRVLAFLPALFEPVERAGMHQLDTFGQTSHRENLLCYIHPEVSIIVHDHH